METYTGTGLFVIMRHGVREDNVVFPGDTQEERDVMALLANPRFEYMPWDPLLAGIGLPTSESMKLLGNNISLIVSSPFSRCLQTAFIAAKILGVKNVIIDYGLGEIVSKINHSIKGTTHSDYFYVSESQMVLEFPGINVKTVGKKPALTLSGYEDATRCQAAVKSHMDKTKNTLVVTHGDIMSFGVSIVDENIQVYDTKECSYVSIDLNTNTVIANERCEIMIL